jgi:hypothetical protein
LELKLCPECGVPELINSEYLWLNNGDIVHSRAQSSRMVVIDTQNLDLLFRNIAQIIGTDLEHLVITAGRRACRIFLLAFVTGEIREKIRKKEIDYELIDAMFRDVARANGIGDYRPVDKRYEQDEKDYCTVSINEPHCLPMAVSAHVGAIESLTEVDQGYRYEEVSPDLYNITAFPSPHQEELSSRMWVKPFEHRDGDIEFERCGTCGGPKILSVYQWHAERGIIVNNTTGRRISIQGEPQLGPVFNELEAELGDTVPRAVVEAQRRFTKSGFYTLDDITDEGGFRTQLALRGLGNLRELKMRKTGMSMRVESAALPYMVVGLSQGFFEMGFGVDSTVDWELSEEGNLQVEIRPVGCA